MTDLQRYQIMRIADQEGILGIIAVLCDWAREHGCGGLSFVQRCVASVRHSDVEELNAR